MRIGATVNLGKLRFQIGATSSRISLKSQLPNGALGRVFLQMAQTEEMVSSSDENVVLDESFNLKFGPSLEFWK